MMTPRLLGLCLALVLSSSTCCAAAADQVLRLMVWEGYAPEAQLDEFKTYIKDKYDLDLALEVAYVSDPNEFFNALRGKTADIIAPTHNLIKDRRFDYIDKGLILPVNLDNIPNYRHIVPSLQKADYITEGGQVYGVPFTAGSYGLAYNSQHLDTPATWNIFWDPSLAGKYSISADFYEVNIYITALSLGYRGAQVHTYEVINNPIFKAKLKALASNAGTMWRGVDKPSDLKGLSLAAVWGFSILELNKRGERWKVAEPREGSMMWVDNFVLGYSLQDKPLLKKIAEEWLNFTISPSYQLEVALRTLGSEPVNATTTTLMTPDEIKRYQMDDPYFFQKKGMLWPTILRIRDRNGMKRLWDEAVANQQ